MLRTTWPGLCLVLIGGWCLVGDASASIVDSRVFLNELHYDNSGRDVLEFIEVAAPAEIANLADYSLTLYNGSNGAAYGGPIGLDQFLLGNETSGVRFYTYETSLQNGAPDGLALASLADGVLQFLSYEGTFQATDGVAAGLFSTEMAFFEPSDTPVGFSLQLGGTGDSYFDFAWQSPQDDTFGALNRNQFLPSSQPPMPDPVPPDQSPVPEPTSVLLWGGLALAIWLRRLRKSEE